MHFSLREKNYFRILMIGFIMCWFSIFLLQKIDFTTADLGRHLKNGEMILHKNFKVLNTNFYSQNYSDYPFVNHHWLTGVVFFLIWKAGGFIFLHLFSVFLNLLVFLILFLIAERDIGTPLALIASLIIIPLLGERTEIRPEIFSYFFSAVFFVILLNYKKGKISRDFLFLLPLLEVFWVNFHIYFFLGPVIIGVFLIEEIILFFKTKKGMDKTLFFVFAFSLFATLLNPLFLKGALYPLKIYKNYGYRVLETQSVMFLEKLGFIQNPNFLLFKIIASLVVFSFILVFVKNRQNFSLANFFLGFTFGLMALIAIRNFALFGFFALPIIASNIKIAFLEKIRIKSAEDLIGISALGLAILIITLAVYSPKFSFQSNEFGLGLKPKTNDSAVFFKKENIKGPIFNNYDIGSYLIYHLFPNEHVFVDNRPEAYPASFFHDIYIPLQENNDFWKKQNEFYKFNAIFFSHKDATPWGQKFLIERVKDSDWASVFADNFAIIFVRRTNTNKELIKKYEISKDNFIITK